MKGIVTIFIIVAFFIGLLCGFIVGTYYTVYSAVEILDDFIEDSNTNITIGLNETKLVDYAYEKFNLTQNLNKTLEEKTE